MEFLLYMLVVTAVFAVLAYVADRVPERVVDWVMRQVMR
jgi:hypothetical protein